MTFLEAYILYGPDVEKIAVAVGIKSHEADRLINNEMDRRHAELPPRGRHLYRPRARVPFVGFDPTEKSWWGR